MPARKNGLHSFAFHREQSAGATAVAAALAVRPGGLGVAPSEDLAALAPERAAQVLLANALCGEHLPGFRAPRTDCGAAELKPISHRRLPLTASQTVKFRQSYRKIPVYGSLITVEMDGRNRLLSINSSLGEPTGVDPIATVSPAAALETVRRTAGCGAEPLAVQPRLYFYFDAAAERWRLAYIVQDVRQRRGGEGAGEHQPPRIDDYVIDAHGGELVARLPRSQAIEAVLATPLGVDEEEDVDALSASRRFRATGVASYGAYLCDAELNLHTYDFGFRSVDGDFDQLPGSYAGRRPSHRWDPTAVSAHANAAEVLDYLRAVLLRHGVDDQGGRLVSSVHCVRTAGRREWRNALWYGGQMVYGQREVGGRLLSYAVALDVVAHEIFHGVTESSARLDGFGESGALDESYADIFGVLIGNRRRPAVEEWDWQIGEELEGTGHPLRDVADPPRCGQPAHLRDFQDLPMTPDGDWGGVHANSGIHNKAAYNLLTAERDCARVFAPATVAKLFYLTLTEQLSRTAGFSDSRRGLELVARSLFRLDPDRQLKMAAIAEAFDAVGIER